MGLVVVLLFPLGAIVMRLGGPAWLHSLIQLISLAALIAGFGLGIELAKMTDKLYNTTHTTFGTVIVALFVVQPFFGIWHHMQYNKTGGRNPVSHAHIWFGRILMILAVINGGLGLKLAANTTKGEIAYGVLAGVVGVAYIALVAFKRKGGARTTNANGVGRRRWGSREKKDVVEEPEARSE